MMVEVGDFRGMKSFGVMETGERGLGCGAQVRLAPAAVRARPRRAAHTRDHPRDGSLCWALLHVAGPGLVQL